MPDFYIFGTVLLFFSKIVSCPQKVLSSSFLIFYNRMYVNKSTRVPILHFRHYATISEKNSSKISSFFQKKALLLYIAPTLDVLALFFTVNSWCSKTHCWSSQRASKNRPGSTCWNCFNFWHVLYFNASNSNHGYLKLLRHNLCKKKFLLYSTFIKLLERCIEV